MSKGGKGERVGNVSQTNGQERAREKTPGQIVNEFEEMLEIERERAKEREKETQLEGKNEDGDAVGGGNVSTPDETGKARDKAAEKVNADPSRRGTTSCG